ncbi:MAG: DUF177 domain-containing protein [Coriobacteriales bacterium]|jgi:uncharacterized protein|nr:DUF177 domain-containing protein [Coriobacteriales bacterium]
MNSSPELIYNLLPELAELGAVRELEGTFELDTLNIGSIELVLDGGIGYKIQLTNTGNGVLLSGSSFAKATTDCARCLEEAHIELRGEVVGYFILRARDEELDLADDEFVLVGSSGKVDLAAAIIASVVFEVPQVILCQEDCRGLCPACGVNRNEQDCSCADEPSPQSPFAALKDLTDAAP